MTSRTVITLITLLWFGLAQAATIIIPGPFARGIPTGTYDCTSLNTSLISYWKMDEVSGNRADSEPTGTAQNLTDVNTVGSTTGIISNAALFVAASSELLSHSDSLDLSTGNIDFTFAAWVYITDKTVSRGIIGKYVGGAGQREYLLRYISSSDRFEFRVSNDGSASTAVVANTLGSPSTSTWYLVIAWHDATNDLLGISINNGTADTQAYSSGVFDSPTAFAIGAQDVGNSFWEGRIDEVGFWKKVLSPSERTCVWNAGAGRTCCAF